MKICKTRSELKCQACTSAEECPENTMCFQPSTGPNARGCPDGFGGLDCMKRANYVDDRCPQPDDLSGVCVPSQLDRQCTNGGIDKCPDGEICCPGSDGCSYRCFTIVLDNLSVIAIHEYLCVL
uniref:uncharacterized protein LOC120347701 n=1 Tax=Styela clava TaxID=7725 RepID=UPI00193A496A|nr:uncharacterized protein LOC120347701 [Styela clava]XP_039274171.1 uncharacterized protein LOC120348114 [Styela clava]